MRDFSYNTSAKLTDLLSNIDEKRIRILTKAISPGDELKLRWQAQVERTHHSFSISGIIITQPEITKILSREKNKNLTELHQQVTDFKKCFDYINQNWLVTTNNVTLRTVMTLASIFSRKKKFNVNEESVKSLLEFLQSSQDHCVILSGIIYIEFLAMSGAGFNEKVLSRLLAYLFLYRSGYDFRGLLKLEEIPFKDGNTFRDHYRKGILSRNLTLWLEYYADMINIELEEVSRRLETSNPTPDVPAGFWELNDRQKEILSILDEPEKSITNRTVQKLFQVSQITASRDLARLASTGTIFPHGRGRSVYYTKV